jgi:RNase H-fold protein (predicted Holliday junction resolvase)
VERGKLAEKQCALAKEGNRRNRGWDYPVNMDGSLDQSGKKPSIGELLRARCPLRCFLQDDKTTSGRPHGFVRMRDGTGKNESACGPVAASLILETYLNAHGGW